MSEPTRSRDAASVRVALHGCDDSTYIDIEVTQDERAFLDRLAALSEEASSYNCQPTLEIKEVDRYA